jgi:peroxiredoxin
MAIAPHLPEFSRELIKEKNFSFELLSDPGNKIANAYGLVHTLSEEMIKAYTKFGIDLPKYNGDDSWTLPVPARYIIDREGVIRYAEIRPDHKDRPEPEHTIEALKAL